MTDSSPEFFLPVAVIHILVSSPATDEVLSMLCGVRMHDYNSLHCCVFLAARLPSRGA